MLINVCGKVGFSSDLILCTFLGFLCETLLSVTIPLLREFQTTSQCIAHSVK